MILLFLLVPVLLVGMFILILLEGLCNLLDELRFW